MNSILVVDDMPENLRLLTQLLNHSGYEVRAVSDGAFGLESAKAMPPDLILLDIRMPNMDGYEVCEQLKADERTRGIPVIFLSALSDVADKLKGFQVGGVDYITKPFQAEEVLSRVKTHLNLYHLHKQLEEANTRLESQNNELKGFASIVSHDLKAPLRDLGNLVRWLVKDYAHAFDQQGQEMANTALERISRMDKSIDGILKYSRAGYIDRDRERIDLNVLVHDVLSILHPPDRIRVITEGELPCIAGERTSLQQVFQNLLGNSIRYMDKSDGKIYIRAVQKNDFWIMSIADNGPGIEERDHERIFDMFQTVSSRDEDENSGVGLAIVKKIVEHYGGKIWLESRPGKGSEFFFTLPGTG